MIGAFQTVDAIILPSYPYPTDPYAYQTIMKSSLTRLDIFRDLDQNGKTPCGANIPYYLDPHQFFALLAVLEN